MDGSILFILSYPWHVEHIKFYHFRFNRTVPISTYHRSSVVSPLKESRETDRSCRLIGLQSLSFEYYITLLISFLVFAVSDVLIAIPL